MPVLKTVTTSLHNSSSFKSHTISLLRNSICPETTRHIVDPVPVSTSPQHGTAVTPWIDSIQDEGTSQVHSTDLTKASTYNDTILIVASMADKKESGGTEGRSCDGPQTLSVSNSNYGVRKQFKSRALPYTSKGEYQCDLIAKRVLEMYCTCTCTFLRN